MPYSFGSNILQAYLTRQAREQQNAQFGEQMALEREQLQAQKAYQQGVLAQGEAGLGLQREGFLEGKRQFNEGQQETRRINDATIGNYQYSQALNPVVDSILYRGKPVSFGHAAGFNTLLGAAQGLESADLTRAGIAAQQASNRIAANRDAREEKIFNRTEQGIEGITAFGNATRGFANGVRGLQLMELPKPGQRNAQGFSREQISRFNLSMVRPLIEELETAYGSLDPYELQEFSRTPLAQLFGPESPLMDMFSDGYFDTRERSMLQQTIRNYGASVGTEPSLGKDALMQYFDSTFGQ